MGRSRTPIGTFGDFTFETLDSGKTRARVRFRDDDGRLRLVQATGPTPKAAEHALKEKLAARGTYQSGYGELSPDSTFPRLVEVWLEDLDLEGRIAPSTRGLYERNMRHLVMPAFEHYLLREITISKVDRFLKTWPRSATAAPNRPRSSSTWPSGWRCGMRRSPATRSPAPPGYANHRPRPWP